MATIHIGHIIKAELDKQGRKVSWFSEQIGKSKSATFALFNRTSIDTNELSRISKILDVDFFRILSDNYSPENQDK